MATTFPVGLADISATVGQQAKAGSLPVTIASDQVVSVSATVLPLPTGAATAALQTTAAASMASIDSKVPAIATINSVATTPVSLPMPSTLVSLQLVIGVAVQQLPANYPVNGFYLRSHPNNTGRIVFGLTNAVTTSEAGAGIGNGIAPGESLPIPGGVNLNTIYAIATAAGQVLEIWGN